MDHHATIEIGEYKIPLIGIPQSAVHEICDRCGREVHIQKILIVNTEVVCFLCLLREGFSPRSAGLRHGASVKSPIRNPQSAMKDLLGNEIIVDQAIAIEADGKKRRKNTQANGYAARPGTGPAGQTCKTCANAVKANGGSRDYYKCLVIRHRWTHGPGTDIRLKSPACTFWKSAI